MPESFDVSPMICSICVYCGSRPGVTPVYMAAAQALGEGLGARSWRLIYGAGDRGLMGEVSAAAQRSGARTLGVIPQHLIPVEGVQSDLQDLIITETMHERKKVMAMNSDGMVVLPGGAGTLDEFFEILTWAQLGLHAKPIVLANIAGFWDPLVNLLNRVCSEKFAEPSLLKLLTIVPTVQDVFEHLETTLKDK